MGNCLVEVPLYINMNRSSKEHLNFLEYRINVHSLFLSHRETALKNKVQELNKPGCQLRKYWTIFSIELV